MIVRYNTNKMWHDSTNLHANSDISYNVYQGIKTNNSDFKRGPDCQLSIFNIKGLGSSP